MAYASLTSTPVLPRVIGPARARGFRRTAGRRGDDRGEVPPQRNLWLAFAFEGLYLLEGVPVTVCAVATEAWEGSPGVAVFG